MSSSRTNYPVKFLLGDDTESLVDGADVEVFVPRGDGDYDVIYLPELLKVCALMAEELDMTFDEALVTYTDPQYDREPWICDKEDDYV